MAISGKFKKLFSHLPVSLFDAFFCFRLLVRKQAKQKYQPKQLIVVFRGNIFECNNRFFPKLKKIQFFDFDALLFAYSGLSKAPLKRTQKIQWKCS